MPQIARAFAPGNVSCIFKIVPHEDPTKMHSLGMGFTVSQGVTVTARPLANADAKRTSVVFNGAPIDFPTVNSVVDELTGQPVELAIESPLPLSSGFGLSGASALASAYALNRLFDLGFSEPELALKAHVAEVRNLTGLGDVCGQFLGGCLMKTKAGDPLAAEMLPVKDRPIYYRYFGPILTKDIIGDPKRKEKINAAGQRALDRIAKELSFGWIEFETCIRISKKFAIESELILDERVSQIISEVEAAGGAASMIMLGNAVFSTTPFPECKKTELSHRNAEVLD